MIQAFNRWIRTPHYHHLAWVFQQIGLEQFYNLAQFKSLEPQQYIQIYLCCFYRSEENDKAFDLLIHPQSAKFCDFGHNVACRELLVRPTRRFPRGFLHNRLFDRATWIQLLYQPVELLVLFLQHGAKLNLSYMHVTADFSSRALAKFIKRLASEAPVWTEYLLYHWKIRYTLTSILGHVNEKKSGLLAIPGLKFRPAQMVQLAEKIPERAEHFLFHYKHHDLKPADWTAICPKLSVNLQLLFFVYLSYLGPTDYFLESAARDNIKTRFNSIALHHQRFICEQLLALTKQRLK